MVGMIFQLSVLMNVVLFLAFMMARSRNRFLEKEVNHMRRYMQGQDEGAGAMFAFWLVFILVVLGLFVLML